MEKLVLYNPSERVRSTLNAHLNSFTAPSKILSKSTPYDEEKLGTGY